MQNFVYKLNIFRKTRKESEKKYAKKNCDIGKICTSKPRIY